MIESDIAEIVSRLSDAGLAQALEGKRVLLTGARGFLGRHLVEVLSRINGIDVLALDKWDLAVKLGAAPVRSLANVEFVDFDVTKPFPVHGRLDYIFSLAGIASPVHYKEYPLETFDVCVTGNRNMLELAKVKGATVLVASSSEVYGDPPPEQVPTKETYRGNVDTMTERSCYDESKRAAETLAWVYTTRFGVPAKIVRPFNVYGPGLGQRDHRVLSRFADAIVRGKRLQVFSAGTQTRTFCYVTDAIFGAVLAAVRGMSGVAYNLGNPAPEVSVVQLALMVSRAAGRDVDQFPIEFAPPPSQYVQEPQRRCPDISRLRQLGYEPQVALHDGLSRFVRWAMDHYDR